MHRVVVTKQYTKCLRELSKKGKKGRDAILKARAASSEVAETGRISIVTRTHHGESRLPNIEKYDLGDGYRLVVQLADEGSGLRAFLFCGDHDDADRWLDNHRDYRWVKRDGDETLDFVQVTEQEPRPGVVPDYDLETPDSLLDLPLLREVTEDEWNAVPNLPGACKEYLLAVSASRWEQDPDGVIEHIERNSSFEIGCLAVDLLTHAHAREWNQLHSRLALAAGSSAIVPVEQAAAAMVKPINSEQFITWEDLESLPEHFDWSDWMLFLHPTQKELAHRDFNGPARLRGVSGSGKTCVMLHRARYLARKYRDSILLVSLTTSTKLLLEELKGELCGAEGTHIRSSTMNSVAFDVIEHLAAKGLGFTMARQHQLDSAKSIAAECVRQNPLLQDTAMSRFSEKELSAFVTDEVLYVRMRLLPADYEKYLSLSRRGRTIPLTEKARIVILDAVRVWDSELERQHVLDHEGVVQRALELLIQQPRGVHELRHRCVLVDEVQDLSQLELTLLSKLPSSEGRAVVDLPNGLFLVGDGAQTVYRKGFSLRDCGVPVANRSYVLKKNYRNTKEILHAAYRLIVDYEFADVDEEQYQAPTPPDYSSRHGERPFLVKCRDVRDEAKFVANRVAELLKEAVHSDEADDHQVAAPVAICIIGFTQFDRDRVAQELLRMGLACSELREDVSINANEVKISTVESAKGHEFSSVFVVGIVEGAMPNDAVAQDEHKREAARLYVAMTRARDSLYLSYDTARGYKPSRFLSSIQEHCDEVTYRGGRLLPHED